MSKTGPERLVAVLTRVRGLQKRPGRDSWRALCPAHDDSDPSLDIDVGRNGNPVVVCRAGCSQEAVLAAIGWTELPRANGNGTHPSHTPAIPAGAQRTTYTYHDAEGREVFYRDRFDYLENGKPAKTVRPRQPDGSVRGTAPVPYRLPRLLKAIAAGEFVLLVEGEKVVDALEQNGFPATTTGAATSWKADYAKYFASGRIVGWPDADKPGDDYIAAAARDLLGVASEVRVLRYPGAPKGWDAADYFAEGGSAEQLEHLLADAPLWEYGTSRQTDGKLEAETDETEHTPTLRFVRACDISTDIAIVEWAANRIILRAEITLIVGDGEVYKTTLLVAIAVFIASGAALFDYPEWTTTRGDVLIITAEDAGPFIRNRIEAIAAGHGLDVRQVLERIHILDVVGADFSIDRPECQEIILAAIREIQPAAVLFDPHAELTSSEENKNDAAKGPVKFYRKCAVTTGSAVIVAHHAGKMTEGRRKIDRPRGASRLVHAARAVFFLERCELGVSIEAIKFNRGKHPDPFVLEHDITEDMAHPGRWVRARFHRVTQAVAIEHGADQFVLAQLAQHGRLNTSQLKEIAKTVPGVSGADVSAAIKRLTITQKIDYEPGSHGAKQWGLKGSVQVAQQFPATLATQFQTLPGNVGQPRQPAARPCPAPYGGKVAAKVATGSDDEQLEQEYEDISSRRPA